MRLPAIVYKTGSAAKIRASREENEPLTDESLPQETLGKLFVDPDVDRAREYFRKKPRALTDKTTTVKAAVAQLIHDGDYVATGGFGTNRIPAAVLHEIVRQGRKNLGLSGHTTTHDFQILCDGGCLDRVDIAYIGALEARGVSRSMRRLLEQGNIQVCEWTNGALSWRYKAAAMGIPFIPARVMLGSDTMKYSAAKTITCPFTGTTLVALPALFPDVAMIHVHRADKYGNCQIDGTTVADYDLARAAKKVIITTEEIVSEDVIRKDPARTIIPAFCVDAVIEVKYGSYPGNMPYAYYSDEEHLREWLVAEAKPETLKPFIEKYILNTEGFQEYLELCGGEAKMEKLRQIEFLSELRRDSDGN
jgi:glutaconate CoA-transferase subunit A